MRDSRPVKDLVVLVADKPRSSALYLELAQSVSLKQCTDRAFLKLKSKLSEWFGEE